MDGHRFDRLTRSMVGTSRRSVLRTLAAGAAGGISVVAFGRDARAQRAFKARLQGLPLEEQAVVLYEGLAELADAHAGNPIRFVPSARHEVLSAVAHRPAT